MATAITRLLAVVTGASNGGYELCEALMAGKDHVLSASLKTKLQGFATRFLPDPVKARLHRKMSEPGTAKH